MRMLVGMRVTLLLGICALMSLVSSSAAFAEKGKLAERLTPEVLAVVYPAGAQRLGPEEGAPPAIAVYQGDKVVAYLFSTLDIVAARGYSTTPFDVIAGVDLTGHITGAKVVSHNESRIRDTALNQRRLDQFLAREAGRPFASEADALKPDFVAGATVSARAMRAAVSITARLVLRGHLARPAAAAPTADAPAAKPSLDTDAFARQSWETLISAGAVVRRRITAGEVVDALAAAGASPATLDVPPPRARAPGDDLYIELATALFTPAAIGGNLVGVVNYEDFKRALGDANAIFVASRGPYDFKGKKFFLDSEGNRFDRLRVVQDGRTFTFVQNDYRWINPFSDGIRGMQDAALFVLPADSGFDPLKPWRLELLVNGAGASAVSLPFGLDYTLPDLAALTHLDDTISERRAQPPTPIAAPVAAPDAKVAEAPAAKVAEPPPAAPPVEIADETPEPAWVEAWRDSRLNIALVAVLLTALTVIFIFQAQLARSRLAHRVVRTGFLCITLFWLGWTAGLQLSIVNVINYVEAPLSGLDLGLYLAEPLMVIIAAYTLVSVLLIGRGVFCGWLCPFGALQELTNQVSRALGVPQWNPSPALEQRLWMGKYIAAAAVLLLALTGLDASGAATEIEPFRTAISARFVRAWPYVAYAGTLIAIGLFTERAYCRFLCPLGGVLAALDRLHILNRLKRRAECGNPCHLCELSCPVGAIAPSGKIVTSECFQCLDCQVEYYDDARCPPLVQAARRGEGAALAVS
jgi:NosR/NirI family transcriptional regulator, nitrous oxide reductase regulator